MFHVSFQMKNIFFLTIAGMLVVAKPSFAEDVCFDYVETAAPMDCSSKYDAGAAKLAAAGADFAGACDEGGTVIVPVEIECESKGKWVSTGKYPLDVVPLAADVCAKVGLKPGSVGGKTCASGERRPASGGDWEFIEYVWGTNGDRSQGGDGPYVATISTTLEPWSDEGPTSEGTFCYDKHQSKRNNTKEDWLIAFYCAE
jgi:hypothetical protein